jgi:ribosomal protein S12 methylthiotransferase accessory factor
VAAASRAIGARAGIIKHISNRMIEADDPRMFQAVTSATDTARLYGTEGSPANSGAGLTWELALASAIGETIERYCCASYDERSLPVSNYRELQRAGVKAIHPEALPLYSESQYRRPGFIHHRFTEDVVVTWTRGYSLIRKEEVWVPACLVYVPFRCKNPGDDIAFGVTTGLSCARSRLEAILGGLYEAVERDAIMIMWMNRLPCPSIVLDSGLWLPAIVKERFAPSGLSCYLNDITTDLSIPTMFALIVDNCHDGLAVVAGAAANLDTEAAALKALTEAAQGRPWLKWMNKHYGIHRFREDFSDVITFDDHVRLYGSAASTSHVRFLIDQPAKRDIGSVHGVGSKSPEQDLKWCLDTLAAKGLDVIIVDVTQPDVEGLGFSVVKVLIPQLADINADHHYPLLGKKRLYTVPRLLGFTEQDTEEADLNPIPHPFP